MPNETDEWLESARRFITTEPECDCDCFLCIRGEHHEGCFTEENSE